MIAYRILDAACFVIHTTLIVFIAGGWAWKRTRRVHLAIVAATSFSWFGLGLYFGIGFCPCTDWHWRIRECLGYTDLPESYIKFLLDTVTGLDLNAVLVDGATFVVFAVSAVLSVVLNRNDKRERLR
ncbi:MAG: DUF2784 domain-containing protein [Candidatus Hydrogenedentales bacterium]|jgi:hypothetical protein